MIDSKIRTLITLANIGSYTKTAKVLSLTQPAVSHHIRQLEEEYGVKIFRRTKNKLIPTPEGEILIKYARRIVALSDGARQALEDCQHSIHRFNVGITPTVGQNLVSQVFVAYCREHPGVHINILTDTIKKIYKKLQNYELDWAIVDVSAPNPDYVTLLLDMDYLCLVVSPRHPFADRASVPLAELKAQRFILRPPSAGTRSLFENHLMSHNETIRDFNIVIEIDNITTIKELVASNLGVTIMAHSAVAEEESSGRLRVVPVENFNMPRQINLVYRPEFNHAEIFEEIRSIYNSGRSRKSAEET